MVNCQVICVCLGYFFSFLTLNAVQGPDSMFTDCAQSSTSAQPGTILFFLGSTTQSSGDPLEDLLMGVSAKLIGDLFEAKANDKLENRKTLNYTKSTLYAKVTFADVGSSYEEIATTGLLDNLSEPEMKQGDDSFIKQRMVFKQLLVDHKDRYPAAYKHITNLDNVGV